MNLLQVIRAIEASAANQPTVNSIVRQDVFRVSAVPDVRYAAFAWLQGEHASDTQGSLHEFAFTLFYVDRLTFDKRNEVEIQSVGVETLENILKDLERWGIVAERHTFRTFNQRFADDCAGVFCNVTLEVPKDTLCSTDFDYFTEGDYSRDYNSDYFVGYWTKGERTVYVI